MPSPKNPFLATLHLSREPLLFYAIKGLEHYQWLHQIFLFSFKNSLVRLVRLHSALQTAYIHPYRQPTFSLTSSLHSALQTAYIQPYRQPTFSLRNSLHSALQTAYIQPDRRTPTQVFCDGSSGALSWA